MSRTRLAIWATGGGLLAAWLASAAGTMPAAPARGGAPTPPQATAPPPAPAERVDLDRELARMTAFLEHAPRPRPVVRNPFTLAPRRAAPSAAEREAVVPEGWAQGPAAKVPTVSSRVSLAGIATDETPSGPRRTAVLSVDGRVVLARVGDELPGPYQVQRIDDDAVELFDPGRQASFRLTLP